MQAGACRSWTLKYESIEALYAGLAGYNTFRSNQADSVRHGVDAFTKAWMIMSTVHVSLAIILEAGKAVVTSNVLR